ncbi:hypothetical protein KSS87_013322 [Heliosperma pusillum]|nr:hypothetical protein KSS87_013322 [Heliosperma pusillum]
MLETSKMELSEEEMRRKKIEEALEVKSLRRIISAYLNYPDAAEDDVKRYETSFTKLRPAHKSLLSHLPSKYQCLRRCISENTIFILNMLEAFEPPLDMSMDVEFYEDEHLECCSDAHHQHHDWNSSHNHHRAIEEAVVSLPTNELVCCAGIDGSSGTANPEGVEREIDGAELSPIDAICCAEGHEFPESNGNVSCTMRGLSSHLNVPLIDVDKVRCIIRNIVRDWASEGQVERDQCYQPILEELKRLFPTRSKESPPCCLVPGAGLGRLALEISRLGFVCQGNEFSYYMMICSSFILNHTNSVDEWSIYPWIHSNCNSRSDDDQLRPVSIPDILPASAGITEGFSMCGGDFIEVYTDPSQEAHNIVEYIEIIWKLLKDGGVWINLGPLLYHFAEAYGENEMSVELSLEDVKKVALHYGFTLEKESTIETTYTTNYRSMMQNRYFAAFWTMTKKTGNNRLEKNDV